MSSTLVLRAGERARALEISVGSRVRPRSFLGDLDAAVTDAVELHTRERTVTTRWFSLPSERFFVE
jgi:hypothetical protein